jgi:hypothetical protein
MTMIEEDLQVEFYLMEYMSSRNGMVLEIG